MGDSTRQLDVAQARVPAASAFVPTHGKSVPIRHASARVPTRQARVPAPNRKLRIILLAMVTRGAAPAEDTWKNVDRIVAVGDVHGDMAQFTTVLRSANVIDKD